MRQTTFIKTIDENKKAYEKKWYIIDAKDQVVGELAAFIADRLRGKNKVIFSPKDDFGDNIIVINADKAVFTSNKEQKKVYYSHSGYIGGLKKINAHNLRQKKPTAILEKAIKGMMPKSKLSRKQLRSLYLYSENGYNDIHAAQKPEELKVK